MKAKSIFLWMLLLLLAGWGNCAWADNTIKTVVFTTTTWTGATIDDGSTIDDCYVKGAGTTATVEKGLSFNNNMKVSNYYVAIPLDNINGSITVTIEGQSRPSLRYALTSNKETLTSVIDIPRPSSGTSVTFTVNDISGSSTYLCLGRNGSGNTIKNVTVTTPDAAADVCHQISIADLRFEHLTYSPSRSNIAGFNLSFSGWQSQTTTGSPNTYSLLLSERSKTDNTIIISTNSANSARKIKQVVLVGASGNGTFTNSAPSSDYTYSTTNADQIVWRNETGASTATISITSTDQPSISTIWVYTDAATTWDKNDIALAFSPASGTAAISQTDYSIDGRVIISGTSEYFRPDDFTASSVTGSAIFNTFHLSTGKVGVNTGASAGTATITATFVGTSNTYYNTATAGSYTLNVVDASTHTKTITIDDMRISKTASSNGINSSYNNLDRILGGFQFEFSGGEGGEGVKFNNGDGILLRKSGSDLGQITITPKKKEGETGNIFISRIDITTNASYTNGTVKVNGTGNDVYINDVSSYSFTGLSSGTFTLAAVDGTGDDDRIYITGFTIYYTDANGVLDESKTPTSITFSKSSDEVSSVGSYTSPTITTSPKNFDITLSSSNTNVASVSTTNWSSNAVSLQGATGTATITASAAASTYFNAATDATYTVTYVDAAAQKWDFRTLNVANTINDTDWKKSGDYYENKFTSTGRFNTGTATTYATTASTTSQIYQLLFGRDNSDGLKAGQIRLFSNYMTFTNSAITIAVPVTEGDKVHVTFDGGNGSTLAGFTFTNAQLESDPSATSITSDDNQTTATLVAQATGYVTLEVSKSKVKLYRIQVSTETRKTLSLRDTSNNYEKNVGTGETASTNNHFSHRVMMQYSDAPSPNPLTYANDASKFHITSSDPSVLDVSNTYIPESSFGTSSSFYFANLIPKSAGTATLTITFDGNDNYKPNSYVSQTYTVYGPGSFSVSANDQEIQKGQLSTINPIITDKNGNPIGIMEMNDGSGRYTTYILGEDDDIPEYTDFFDFTYTAGTGSGTNYSNITVDESGNITTGSGDGEAAVGATRLITVTATPKSAYESAFSSTSAVTKDITVTIIEKTADVQVEFYWDAACSAKITMADPSASVTGDDNTYADKVWTFNSVKFSDGFPNGRILYVKPKNEGDAIWFSYAQDANAAVIPANPTLDRKNRVYQYRRGIPIYIDENLSGSNYVNVNVVATTYDASTKKYTLRGTVARLMFPNIKTHDRPAEPTYDPISPDATASLNKDGRKIMNTSENVVAYGEGASKTNPVGAGNLVYGKFSTGTVYTTEQLINENAVQKGTGSVPVVSTEVAKRRFTAVQVKPYSDIYGEADYVSEQTYTEYWYLFDTDLRLYSNAEKTTPLQSLDITTNATTATPYYKVTWYNKRNYDDPGNYSLGVTQEVDDYTGKITYAIDTRNGASDATIDTNTGIVTSGSEQGWVRVKVTYTGGETHGGKSGEPQYTSTTDESSAYYYVYIFDSTKERPTITPPTRNFTGTMSYTITAPTNWNVYYTTDGTTPAVGTGTPLGCGTSVTNTIGSGMTVDQSVVVKAIAYDPNNTSLTSAVVSETYTLRAAIPDPVFDPDGVGTPYVYNTSELIVQIACAYAGSVIYYTISDLGSEPYPDPVIGAANTYRYSGLSKVTVAGEKVIKAIAYDPVLEIYSNVVTSTYRYSSEMDKPYFQISNDEGATWWGFNSSNVFEQNATCWNNGQPWTITPSTQIRIIDPNPVKGTIFYTVNGDTPADNATTLVYAEGYPFTVGKSTTGNAITILEDASSGVATAEFNIMSGNVWEAVVQTTPNGTLSKDDGFVISTNSSLSVRNTGSKVNVKSLASGGTGFITYAQADITAIFGGFDQQDWTAMTIADAATGAPLDGVGTYSIKNDKNNAQTEMEKNYNHVYSYKTTPAATGNSATAALTHDKTFKVPAKGAYVRFEPEKDGDLTIWVLQQGALLYEDDTYFIDNVLRIRPVYMVDEQGRSLNVKVVNNVPQLWSSARLSENWSKIQAMAAANGWKDSKYDAETESMVDTEDYAQYIRKADGVVFQTQPSDYSTNASAYKRIVNKGPNRAETATIYNLYKADLDKNHVGIGDPIKPFALHTGSSLSLNDGQYIDDSNDGTGYVLASGGYAKYTFEVKAGKTYYFFAQGSKIGVRGFQFVPTETGSRTTVTVDSASTTAPAVADTPVDVTLNRTFSAGTWTSLVLPFSVSATQLEQVFGDARIAPEVIHFDKVTQSGVHWRLVLMKHYHQMIVAGTPVLIKPAKSVYHPTFHGVHIETSEVESMTQGDYTMMGSLVKTADNAGVKTGDYFMSTSGTIKRWTGTDHYMPGTYAWLRPTTPEAAGRVLSFTYEDVVDGTTGIVEVEQGTAAAENIADGTVYDLRGIKVSDNSLKGLPKGVYIVNSKKIIVK